MHLKTALDLHLDYNGVMEGIHVDSEGYFNLTDFSKFFPHKKFSHWKENLGTKEFIRVVERLLNPELSNLTSGRDPGEFNFKPAIKTRRGRGGGVYAHKYVAMEFAMWLSPEFKLEVIQAYDTGVVQKDRYNMERLLAATGYKILTHTVRDVLIPEFEKNRRNPHYAFTEEADLINLVVFGKKASEAGKNQRDNADPADLEIIQTLQQVDTGLIEAGLSYKERFMKLSEICARRRARLLLDAGGE